MPRFVLLRHKVPTTFGRPSHWDLMLEDGPSLQTWALETLPTPDAAVPALPLAPHRSAYLDYEGPVSQNRGTVRRRDAGVFQWVERQPQMLQFVLRGSEFQGTVTLRRPDGSQDGSADKTHQCWLLEFSADTSATRAG